MTRAGSRVGPTGNCNVERNNFHVFGRARDQRVIRRNFRPVRFLVERLGHDDDLAAAGLAIIERVGGIVDRDAKRIEIPAVCDRAGEAQALTKLALVDQADQRLQHGLRCAKWIAVESRAHHGEEHGFRIGRAQPRGVVGIGDQRLDLAPQAIPAADEAVVHEHPLAAGERMAILPRHRRAGGGAHMGEEQMRAQMATEVAQVFVRPGRTGLAVKAGLRMLAIPAETKAVAVRARGGLQRADALRDQRMLGLGDVRLERGGLAPVCDPAAHAAFLSGCGVRFTNKIACVGFPGDVFCKVRIISAACFRRSFTLHCGNPRINTSLNADTVRLRANFECAS
ncbi:hypothetical protein ACVWZR_009836 [Bradyrhizobium sp. i1.3.1]